MKKKTKTYTLSFLILLLFSPLSFAISSYGPTTARDNLKDIAKKFLTDEKVSLKEGMHAIAALNPNAFIAGDFNRLKPGYILYIPKSKTTALNSKIAKKKEETFTTKINETSKINLPHKNTSNKNYDINKNAEQLLATKQDLNTYKNETKLLILELQANNTKQENQLLNLTANVVSLESNLSMLQKKYEAINFETQKTSHGFFFSLQKKLKSLSLTEPGFIGLLITITAFLILLFWVSCNYFEKRKKYPDKKNSSYEYEDEGEYNFLDTKEGFSAKLDLARVYIDMNDKENAMQILKEVIANGNDEQITEANLLLKKIS